MWKPAPPKIMPSPMPSILAGENTVMAWNSVVLICTRFLSVMDHDNIVSMHTIITVFLLFSWLLHQSFTNPKTGKGGDRGNHPSVFMHKQF